jgi:hypothetical protein
VLRVLVTVGTLATIVGWSAQAEAKKAKKLKMDPSVPETPEPTGPVPPEADAAGHVNFGNPQAEGLGRVTVKSESGDKIQVYLDGRYFGDTPVTIYSVPKGDYIVEGTIVSSGKQISKPVSVMENEEATVELGSAKAEAPVATADAPSTFTLGGGELSDTRRKVAIVCLGVGAAGLVAGIVGGILTMKYESDYEKTDPNPFNDPERDDIRSSGRTTALVSNIGFALTGAGIVGAAIAAYPMFFKTEGDKAPDAKTTAFSVTPIFGRHATGGALTLRF